MESKKHEISSVVILYKMIAGIVEVFFGISLLIFGKTIGRIYGQFRIRELLEDPHDTLINFINKFIVTFIAHQKVYIAYLMFSLLFLGLAKIIASVGMIRRKEWGLDLMIFLIFLLFPFDIAALVYHFTALKLVYFLVNLLIALYLMEFKPHHVARRLKKYFKKSI